MTAALLVVLCGRSIGEEGVQGAAHPLFTPGCTVVLFSGLPGDIESENSYREQTQSWIETVVRSGQVQRLHVLCDQPELLSLPGQPKSEAWKGDRQGFLELGRKLAAERAPAVVIVWGHGGNQRSIPVLHVRGPRITPEDFAGVASQLGPAGSKWILLFRGSGAFARAVVGNKGEPEGREADSRKGAETTGEAAGRAGETERRMPRQVISSDFETAFTSDPIGMSVLLKLMSDGKRRSFERLAHDFGRATAAWYEERSLARTEEPTSWRAGEQPRRVALEADGEGEITNAKGETDESKVPKGAQSGGARDEGGGQRTVEQNRPENTEPPAEWQEIKKVAAEKYPESDAIVLRQSLRCTLGSSPAVVTEQEKFIQILTPEGKQFGDFDVSFAPPAEDLEFLDCEVLDLNGKITRLDPEAIREAREPELGEYARERRKFFSLPGVVPGVVLHVRFRTQWKEFPLPKISMALPAAGALPILKAQLQVSVPKDAPFHFAFQNLQAPDPEIKSTSYSTSYSWALEKLPAQRNEVLSPPGQASQLLISTFADWRAFAEWYGRISRLTDEVTPEIAAKAKELTVAAKSDREKVYALYHYVTALRYVAIPLGINSLRPHAAVKVLQNQYGDCKDKANLLNALLHAIDLDASLVLVPRFSQADEAIPGLAFNHAISRVRLAGQTLWLDTTDDICRFGMLPPGDPGRKVLPIDGQTADLTRLPAPGPEEHRLSITGRIAWSEKPDGMPIELKATASGYPDYELRATAREAREHRASLPLLAVKLRPSAGAFALTRQSVSAISALQEDFCWQADGACIGLAARSGNAVILRSPFWVPREWDQALHQRRSPLYLNQGYPLTLEEGFVFALPSGSKAIELPKVCEHGQGPLRWRVEWTIIDAVQSLTSQVPGQKATMANAEPKIANYRIRARFSAQMQQGELTAGDTRLVQEQVAALLGALTRDANLSLPP